MTVIVGLVSQKGGVGKSTLARALGAIVAHAGLKVRVADLDPQQHTVVEWDRVRGENRLAPALHARGFATVAQALAGMAPR
jgi:chromosome partitioning protein